MPRTYRASFATLRERICMCTVLSCSRTRQCSRIRSAKCWWRASLESHRRQRSSPHWRLRTDDTRDDRTANRSLKPWQRLSVRNAVPPRRLTMKTNPARMLITAGALLAIAAVPMVASAQASLLPIKVTEKQSRAAELDRKAESFETENWGKIRTAAKLREEAASLRDDADVLKSASLYWAARDHYYAENTSKARDLMVDAAQHAMEVGDVIRAASAYTDAAFISADLKDVASTKLYATKARMLANSPMLSQVQKDDVLSRLAFGGLTEQRVASLGTRR